MVLLDNGGRSVREVELLAPPDDLVDCVEHAWIQQARYTSGRDWRVVADASPHLIATVHEATGTRSMRVVVVGARARAAAIDVGNRLLTVGLRFRPGTLPLLTQASAREFVDRATGIGDAFAAPVLRDLELGADAPAAVIVRELMRLTRRAIRRHPARQPTGVVALPAPTVAALAARAGRSTRSLLDRAYHDVGLSPKRILRIARLHNALHAARRGDNRPWSAVAAAAGYADQPHFNRELRALLGETPSAWAARGCADSFKTGSPDPV